MINDSRQTLQMRIVGIPMDISSVTSELTDEVLGAGGHQGVMMCRELKRNEAHSGERVGNSAYPSVSNSFTWLVLVPKYLSYSSGVTGEGLPSSEAVTPPYKVGEIIYCTRLDMPVVMAGSKLNYANNHPSVLAGNNWSKIVNANAAEAHFDATFSPATNMIFWLDLNVDGRTRSASTVVSGGTSGTAQNVWL